MSRDTELLAALHAIPLELANIMAGLQPSGSAQPITGHRSITADKRLLWGGPGRLVGWSMRCPGATAAMIALRDGRDASGEVLAFISVTAGGASTHSIAAPGVSFTEGLYLDVLAGSGLQLIPPSIEPTRSITGAVWIGAVD